MATTMLRSAAGCADQRIFCDVSSISKSDLKTGIERVVRAIFREMTSLGPNVSVIPTVVADGVPVVSKAFAEQMGLEGYLHSGFGLVFRPGDHFVMLDWAPQVIIGLRDWLLRFRADGGIVTAVVYDLLPIEAPKFFPDWMRNVCCEWLVFLLEVVDNFACISKSVAETLMRLSANRIGDRRQPISLAYFHLGFDVAASSPSMGLPANAEHVLGALASRPTFLVLGTIEPRKGHSQALAAFEELWADRVDVGLLIVGKEGWMMGELVTAIRAHEEFGRRLIWLYQASDEFLPQLFTGATALLAPSQAEGFGLPLIEAADYQLPILARDIPVFREVAGDHAYFFSGTAASDLARSLRDWLELNSIGQVPSSANLPRLRWSESVRQLFDIMSGRRRYMIFNTEHQLLRRSLRGLSPDPTSRTPVAAASF